jgi:hypothetical protein
MVSNVQTDPRGSHPSLVRELRLITALLARILVQRGLSEGQALREAEALLRRVPPGRERVAGRSVVGRAG